MVRYRIYHPDDAPSSPNPRSALITVAADARDEMADVTVEGDESVIALARERIARMPGSVVSSHWLTRVTPQELRAATTSSAALLPFRAELVSGEDAFTRRAPPALRGEAQTGSFTEYFAMDLITDLPLLDTLSAEIRDWYLNRLEYDLWGFMHWRRRMPSSERAAAEIARGLAEEIASERERLARGGVPVGKQPGYTPLIKETVTEEEALSLARAFVAAFEAASLEDPAALAADLRRRVQALHLL